MGPKIGVVVSNPDDWTARAIARGLKEVGVDPAMLEISELSVEIGTRLSFRRGGADLLAFDTLIIRDMGRGSPQDVAFRFESLRALQDLGKKIINPGCHSQSCKQVRHLDGAQARRSSHA